MGQLGHVLSIHRRLVQTSRQGGVLAHIQVVAVASRERCVLPLGFGHAAAGWQASWAVCKRLGHGKGERACARKLGRWEGQAKWAEGQRRPAGS